MASPSIHPPTMETSSPEERIYLLSRDSVETERCVVQLSSQSYLAFSYLGRREIHLYSLSRPTRSYQAIYPGHNFWSLAWLDPAYAPTTWNPEYRVSCMGPYCSYLDQFANFLLLASSLNSQHHFLTALLGNHLIHPSIPKDKTTAVADVGTGTGYEST